MTTNEKKNLVNQGNVMSIKMADKEKSILKKSWEFIKGGVNEQDIDDEEEMSRMNLKNTPINHKQDLEMINYLASEHAMCLQKSQYIKFENDVHRIVEHKERSRQA